MFLQGFRNTTIAADIFTGFQDTIAKDVFAGFQDLGFKDKYKCCRGFCRAPGFRV
jgi:hypothetical protein